MTHYLDMNNAITETTEFDTFTTLSLGGSRVTFHKNAGAWIACAFVTGGAAVAAFCNKSYKTEAGMRKAAVAFLTKMMPTE